jgi:hypothetical protein
MTLPTDVLGDPVLTAGGHTYTWSHVFLTGRLWGEWEELERAAAHAEADATDDELRRAGARFRTARRLLAADELRAWLAEHRLTQADWRGYLRRELGRAGDLDAAGAPDEHSIWAEGVCSGTFERWSHALAARAAALAADPAADAGLPPRAWLARAPDAEPAVAADLWSAEAAYERLRGRVAASNAAARVVAGNGVDWLRAECEFVVTPDEDVAREAALLLREDGLAVAEVARLAALEPVVASPYVCDIPPELRAPVVSAAPGDRLGPVALDDGSFVVLLLRGKVAPTMEDPEIRERAERAALESAVEHEVTERVSWHEHG